MRYELVISKVREIAPRCRCGPRLYSSAFLDGKWRHCHREIMFYCVARVTDCLYSLPSSLEVHLITKPVREIGSQELGQSFCRLNLRRIQHSSACLEAIPCDERLNGVEQYSLNDEENARNKSVTCPCLLHVTRFRRNHVQTSELHV